MNNIIKLLLLVVFTSCTTGVIPTNETEVNSESNSKTPIKITATIKQSTNTRAGGSPEPYTFRLGDEIGVSMSVDNQPAVVNVPFTLTEEGWVAEEDIYYPDHGKKATLSFYFPYKKDLLPNNDLKGYIHLSTNQQSLGKMEQFSTCQLTDITKTDEALKVNLELQLVKIYFQMQPGADYTLEELQASTLELTDCFTHGVYEFTPMSFNDYYGLDNLHPAGEWVIDNEANIIKGEYCLIFPNALNSMTEIVHINDQQFSASVPTKTMNGESIQAGNAYTFKMTPNNSNRTYSHSSVSVEVNLTDWIYHDTEEITQQNHVATNGLIIKELDFSESKILSIMHTEKEVGVITKELKIDDSNNTALEQIIAYPKTNNEINWNAGIVLSENGNPAEATVYLNPDYTLSDLYTNGGLGIYSEPKVLMDKRNGHIYPLVRIGNLTWTTENVHEKMTTDYSPLEKVTAIPANSLNPLYTTWTDTKSTEHFFYPLATFSSYQMTPAGWRLPNQNDIVELTKMYNNPEYLLASSTTNNVASKIGLNLNQSGYIEEATHKNENSFTGLWVQRETDFLIFTIEPKATGGYAYHLYSTEADLFNFDTSAFPVRWVAE